ncbi:MAG TPA: hypothetical protein VK662_12190, partial [Acidothermaceae bacterium]|nr:hypothetical protein [Acidothermaceae bacterium]
MRKSLALALVVTLATAWAPVATHAVGAVERQRSLPACSAVADGVAGAATSGQLITVVAPTIRS